MRLGHPGGVRIHLDTDLGGDTDDACALAMLLGWPDVEITGITTVADPGGRRARTWRICCASLVASTSLWLPARKFRQRRSGGRIPSKMSGIGP
jgi:hypothetical protein